MPGEVWEDPYAEGVARDATDRGSSGVRIQCDRVMGSAFGFALSWRDVSIDTELSGESVSSAARDGYRLPLGDIYLGIGFTVASDDEANPIYGVETDSASGSGGPEGERPLQAKAARGLSWE